MKHLYYISLAVMLLPLCVAGQNLVTNGSFEDTIGCPTNQNQVSQHCRYWRKYTTGSSDFYQTCGSTMGIPSNLAGYQYAAEGNAYCGFAIISGEYLVGQMQQMYPGRKYEVSLSVSLSDNSSFATENIGVFFYDLGPTSINSSGVLNFQPHVYYDNYGIITDTANWVRLTKSFIADSTYSNIVIGPFKNSLGNINTLTVNTNVNGTAYYYVDSVVVKPLDSLLIDFNRTKFCIDDTFTLSFFCKKQYAQNNAFTAQLSDPNGNFNSPINIGSSNQNTSGTILCSIPSNTIQGTHYRIRVIASNMPDTSNNSGYDIQIDSIFPSPPVVISNSPVCQGDTISLSASSTTSGVTYSWTGPNNFFSTLNNPNKVNAVYQDSGKYIIRTILGSCSLKDTINFVINERPSMVTAGSNSPLCEGESLYLTGTTSSIGVTSYNWNGVGSYTSSLKNPAIPSATTILSGDYIFSVYKGNCFSMDTISVLVKPLPANFSSTSNSPVCSGEYINFTASSSSTGVTYAWAGPNGFNSTSATPFINGGSAIHNGNYFVTTTYNGCSIKDTLPVIVKPLPIKPVATSNTPLCAGSSLNLTVGNSAGSSFGWTGPASFTSSTQNPTIGNTTTAMSGEYIVTIDSNGCINKDTTTVQVKPLPTPVTTSSNAPICAGTTLQLSSTASSTGVTYSWTGPGSYTSSTQNSSRTSATSGMTGWYKMSVDLNGCTTADSTYATVNPIPAMPSITFNNPLCVGETLNLNASTVSGATYSWTGANNFTSNLQNPSRANMQFGDTGSYSVTASANGCTSPGGTVKVNLNANPFVVIFANPADSTCQGDPVVFTALPNNHGGTPSYQWKVNTQTAGTGAVFTTTALNDKDVILCEMTENTKCSVPYKDESNDIKMTVLPWLAPSVTITASPNHPLDEYEYVSFTAVATDAGISPKYQWKRNGQNIVGATGSVWSANTLNDNDSVSVEVISDYECPQPTSAVSNWIRIRTTGVTDVAGFNRLVLYPNPNKGKFTIEAPLRLSPPQAEGGLVDMEVMNTLGQVVYSDNIAAVNGALHKEINLGNVASGVYLLRIKSDDGRTASLRFTVE